MFEGELVSLRPMTKDDIDRQRELFQNPNLAGLDCNYPHQYASMDVEALFEQPAKPNPDTAFFAIEVKGEYVGYCGLMHLRHSHRVFELGINIGDPEHWNSGYGKDAVRLLLHYGFHYLGGRRIELTTHEQNKRAIGCYLACGFVEEGRARQAIWIEGHYIDLVEMAILRQEWEATT
jgi:RimJ/RimL family protein N-acetyltransferase